MAWIESHQDLRTNPKAKRLARRLEVPLPQAIGHLHMLWWWALDHAFDGNLDRFDAYDIADAAGFEGDEQSFLDALIDAGGNGRSGFIDRAPSGQLSLHDWHEFTDAMRAKRQASEKAHHTRWHAKRGIVDDNCRFCDATAERPQSDRNADEVRSHAVRNAPTRVSNAPEPEPGPGPGPTGTGTGTETNPPPPARAHDDGTANGQTNPREEGDIASGEQPNPTPLADDLIQRLPPKIQRRITDPQRRKLEPTITDAINRGHTTATAATAILDLDRELGPLDQLDSASATSAAITHRLQRTTTPTTARAAPPDCRTCGNLRLIEAHDDDPHGQGNYEPCPDCCQPAEAADG